jgi:predicted nucleic acid-binding protein
LTLIAVLDANVLFPFHVRNLLLHLAVVRVYEPLWSEQIIDEARRNLLKRDRMAEDAWDRVDVLMRRHFSDAYGKGFEGLIDKFELPAENDRHVLALAVHYEADIIVTYTRKIFRLLSLRHWE